MTDPESLRIAVLEVLRCASNCGRPTGSLTGWSAWRRWAAAPGGIMKMGALLAVLAAAGAWAWDHLR